MTREFKLKMLIIDNFIPPEEKSKLEQKITFNEETDDFEINSLSTSQRYVMFILTLLLSIQFKTSYYHQLRGLSHFSEDWISVSYCRYKYTNGVIYDCCLYCDVYSRKSMMKRPQSAYGRPTSQYAKMAAAVGFNPRYRRDNILLVELDLPTRTTRDYIGPTVAPKVRSLNFLVSLWFWLNGDRPREEEETFLISINQEADRYYFFKSIRTLIISSNLWSSSLMSPGLWMLDIFLLFGFVYVVHQVQSFID